MTYEEYNAEKNRLLEQIDIAKKMEKLTKNKEFKELFIEKFLEQGALNTLRMIEHETVKSETVLNRYKHNAIAIGVVKNYIDAFIVEGNFARDQLIQLEEMFQQQEEESNN